MKWCTAKARCSAGCRATTGSASPTCARCWAINGCSPARSCCSWAANSARAREWNANGELDWWLLEAGPYHRGVQRFVEDLNKLYLRGAGLCGNRTTTPTASTGLTAPITRTACFPSCGRTPDRSSELVVMLNLTPVPRSQYRVGLPRPGNWREVLNSDAAIYGGSNTGQPGRRHGGGLQMAQPTLLGGDSPCRRSVFWRFNRIDAAALAEKFTDVQRIKNRRPACAGRREPNPIQKSARLFSETHSSRFTKGLFRLLHGREGGERYRTFWILYYC